MDCNINNNLWTGQWIKTKITGDTEIRAVVVGEEDTKSRYVQVNVNNIMATISR